MNENTYKNWYSMSDRALLSQIGSFVKQHRMDQNKTQEAVSRAAGISRSTLSLLERGETVTLATLIHVLRVLELFHVMEVFDVPRRISPIALAREEQKQRRRARRSDATASTDTEPTAW